MPSPEDTIRLAKILGISNEEAGLKADISKKDSKGTSSVSPLDSRSAKNKRYRESCNKNRRYKVKAIAYATQPVSFISCGIMESEPGVTIVAFDESKPRDQTAGSSSYCAFEMHTTGFGSRMMAKLGYVDATRDTTTNQVGAIEQQKKPNLKLLIAKAMERVRKDDVITIQVRNDQLVHLQIWLQMKSVAWKLQLSIDICALVMLACNCKHEGVQEQAALAVFASALLRAIFFIECNWISLCNDYKDTTSANMNRISVMHDVAKNEIEKMLIQMVEAELEIKKKNGKYKKEF
ncbi:hypothetical protein Tco_0993049 [Tanacetum coccineum]|uniref:Uncharacterized protein n=1 Tax=Tanacetum coccineum TaxID=301880 RepID=A0ABQ5F488_9ASTR